MWALLITFVILLIVIIVSGRILNLVNLSNSFCKGDHHITEAHTWAAWTVGLSSAAAAIALIILILAAAKAGGAIEFE